MKWNIASPKSIECNRMSSSKFMYLEMLSSGRKKAMMQNELCISNENYLSDSRFFG